MKPLHAADCQKPPLIKKTEVLAEYILRATSADEFWIDVRVNRQAHDSIGPFETEDECHRAYDDLLAMQRSSGGQGYPDASAVADMTKDRTSK